MRFVLAVFTLALCACGGPSECKLGVASSCSSGQVCEPVMGRAKPLCFKPVQLQGTVKSLSTGAPVSGATVVAIDDANAPVGVVATSASDGTYSMGIPSPRSDDKGTVISRKLLLHAAAPDYENFPGTVRVTLPIDTSTAVRNGDGPWILTSPLTTIGLADVPALHKGRAGILGTVALPDSTSALIVAEGPETFTAVPDSSGAFHLFNVAAGHYSVQAYTAGHNFTAASVDVAATDVTGVMIAQAGTSSAQVNGKVQLVAGANNTGTSVVLAIESTYVPALGRGEVPPGLRAPDIGVAPDVTGPVTLHGVPDGKYVLLAAMENDGNVRDPDPNIAGTQVPHVVVSQGNVTPADFDIKVTGAIAMTGPGADGTIEPVSSTVTFGWASYASAQSYSVTVYNSSGTKIWENLAVTGTSLAYGGPALQAGEVYQWRATAFGNASNPISTTEELRGLFSP